MSSQKAGLGCSKIIMLMVNFVPFVAVVIPVDYQCNVEVLKVDRNNTWMANYTLIMVSFVFNNACINESFNAFDGEGHTIYN